ncbi:HAD superfamily phosphatase [Lactobacillus selangorensis]|uniref:HAD superfamily phosphatase n=1 Tax=Lactobacillus selangorensis TaxID=81857 RepID=A0A0R2FVP4_9LACO|nr:hypothetical protein [Lactobacillus selangorensis]KRN28957.1 HAD superfamily phosphatase [Lactobacillus selangorensis]KRN32633.1 HAD superfamily phosphatase [Lactobacillus selangorensis]
MLTIDRLKLPQRQDLQPLKRPVWAFDLDGTVFSMKRVIHHFNDFTGKSLKLADMTDYSFAKVYGLPDEVAQKIIDETQTDVILNSNVLQKAADLAQRAWQHGYEVDIVTARKEQYLPATIQALKQGHIPYRKIYIGTNDKGPILEKIHAVHYFDDQGQLIQRLKNSSLDGKCELTLIDAPYNQGFECDDRMAV